MPSSKLKCIVFVNMELHFHAPQCLQCEVLARRNDIAECAMPFLKWKLFTFLQGKTSIMKHDTAATYQKLSQLCDAVIVRIAVMTPQEHTVDTAT